MNIHAPVPFVSESYSSRLSEHYAAVRARLGGMPNERPPEIPATPLLFLAPPAEQHCVVDVLPDQRGKDVLPVGAEAEVIAARRALMAFARLRESEPSANSVRQLQVAVASAFKVDLWVILGRSRRPCPVRIRHIAMMLAHCCCKTSREDVSRRFDRNHATVMYAEKKLAAFLEGATSRIGRI